MTLASTITKPYETLWLKNEYTLIFGDPTIPPPQGMLYNTGPPLISCDPDSKQMAFAFFLGGRCRDIREFPLKPREAMLDWMATCQEIVGPSDNLWLVIEDQWLGRNQKTLISLVEARMIVEMTTERLPRLLPVYRVHPVTWQKDLHRGEQPRLSGAALQERVRETAEMLVHASIPSQHVCSAVCIGQWAVTHLKEYAYV